MTDIKQRLQPSAVWREVVSQKDYGDQMQLLARDALLEIERLERIEIEARKMGEQSHAGDGCICWACTEALRQVLGIL